MADESKSPAAAAAVAQTEAEVRRAEAIASLVGSGSLSVKQADEAVVSSADLARWPGLVVDEVRRVSSKVGELCPSLYPLAPSGGRA